MIDGNRNVYLLENKIYLCIFTQAGYYGYVISYF